MSTTTLEQRNREIRKRILNVSNMRLLPLPPDSPWIQPLRVTYNQDGRTNNWDLMVVRSSVVIVIFNVTRKKLVFVRQFRPPSFLSELPEKQLEVVDLEKYVPELGLTIELCAGTCDKDKLLVQIAQDEVREECGYDVPLSAFEKIITYRFVANTAKQTLFFVEVTDEMNTYTGGGLAEEGELIEIVEMTIDEAKKYIESEEVPSPPSLLNGISWFLMNKKDKYA